MGVFKRGGIWWYEFRFAGQRIRESSKSRAKSVADAAERKRHRELEEGYLGIAKRQAPRLFSVAAAEWLKLKEPRLSPRSFNIEQTNLRHLADMFDRLLVTDIKPEHISKYQRMRIAEGAAPKTVNLEVATVRAILRRNKVWESIRQDVSMLPTRDDFGRAITRKEEETLLAECAKSRSRALYPAVVVALHTGLRYSDVRLLTWDRVHLGNEPKVQVGKSKTAYSTGRTVPLTLKAAEVIRMWAAQFPKRNPNHFVFPAERYGASGDIFKACAYETDPSKPIGSFKKGWQAAQARAGVKCRFHDLRHTACTRMLEAGVSLPVIAAILGWSPATTVRMSKRYGHIGLDAMRRAVDEIVKHDLDSASSSLGSRSVN